MPGEESSCYSGKHVQKLGVYNGGNDCVGRISGFLSQTCLKGASWPSPPLFMDSPVLLTPWWRGCRHLYVFSVLLCPPPPCRRQPDFPALIQWLSRQHSPWPGGEVTREGHASLDPVGNLDDTQVKEDRLKLSTLPLQVNLQIWSIFLWLKA